MAFTTKFSDFIFSYFIIFFFFVPLVDIILAEPSPQSLQLGLRICSRGLGILKIYI